MLNSQLKLTEQEEGQWASKLLVADAALVQEPHVYQLPVAKQQEIVSRQRGEGIKFCFSAEGRIQLLLLKKKIIYKFGIHKVRTGIPRGL